MSDVIVLLINKVTQSLKMIEEIDLRKSGKRSLLLLQRMSHTVQGNFYLKTFNFFCSRFGVF